VHFFHDFWKNNACKISFDLIAQVILVLCWLKINVFHYLLITSRIILSTLTW
jgi:hypothetical protein